MSILYNITLLMSLLLFFFLLLSSYYLHLELCGQSSINRIRREERIQEVKGRSMTVNESTKVNERQRRPAVILQVLKAYPLPFLFTFLLLSTSSCSLTYFNDSFPDESKREKQAPRIMYPLILDMQYWRFRDSWNDFDQKR